MRFFLLRADHLLDPPGAIGEWVEGVVRILKMEGLDFLQMLQP